MQFPDSYNEAVKVLLTLMHYDKCTSWALSYGYIVYNSASPHSMFPILYITLLKLVTTFYIHTYIRVANSNFIICNGYDICTYNMIYAYIHIARYAGNKIIILVDYEGNSSENPL